MQVAASLFKVATEGQFQGFCISTLHVPVRVARLCGADDAAPPRAVAVDAS